MRLNKKGFSLIEIVITIAILGVITSVIYSVFQFSIDSYYSGANYAGQQDRVNNTMQILRSQIEESNSIKYFLNPNGPESVLIISDSHYSSDEIVDLYLGVKSGVPSNEIKAWKFENEELLFLKSGKTSYEVLINGIDIGNSGFGINGERLIVKVKPLNINEKYKNRNIMEPIVMEFSISNKFIE